MDPPRLPVDYTTRVRAISAAQRFPIEVVTRVMVHIPEVVLELYKSIEAGKKLFIQCSLVCTYWAIHLRTNIFKHLSICTRDDAERLLEFAKVTTLGASIGQYVQYLRVEWSIPCSCPPWAHLLLHLLPLNLFPRKPIITMVVSKDNSGDPTTDVLISPPNPFHDLPRTLPFPASRNVDDILVQNLHFASLADLVSFAIPSLHRKRNYSEVHCTFFLESSTWSEDVQEAHIPFPRHMLHWLKVRIERVHLFVKARSVPWPLIHSWLSNVTASPTQSTHDNTHATLIEPPDADELHRAWTLLQTLPKHVEAGNIKYNHSSLICQWEDFDIQLRHDLCGDTRFVEEIDLDIKCQDCIVDHPNLSPSKLDLTELDRQMSAFPQISYVVIRLPEDQIEEYEPIIRARMPILAERLEQRFCIHGGVYILGNINAEGATKTEANSGEMLKAVEDTETEEEEEAAGDVTAAEDHPSADEQGASTNRA